MIIRIRLFVISAAFAASAYAGPRNMAGETFHGVIGRTIRSSLDASNPPALPTPTLVQHFASSSNPVGVGIAGNDFRFTLPNIVRGGNTLILGIAFPHGAAFSAVPVEEVNTTDVWPTAPSAFVSDVSLNVDLAIFVLPNAAGLRHTLVVHFTAPILPFQYSISEFTNIDPISPVNGSAGASNVAAPSLTSGSFTPGNNDANGGNLIWSFFWNDSTPGSGNEVVTFSAGPGFTLLDADIMWHRQANAHHAAQYLVQTKAGAINPSMTALMSPSNDRFIGLSIALRVGTSGSVPATGIRIANLTNNSLQAVSTLTSATLQIPSRGNLVVLVTSNGNNLTNVTSVTDSNGNNYSRIEPALDEPQFWIAANAITDQNLKVTINFTSGSARFSWTAYDIVGAAAAPVGVSAGVPTFNCSNTARLTNFPTITPSSSSGLVITRVGIGTGPGLGFFTGSPSGAILAFTTYTGETDLDVMNNADLASHFYNPTTATENWNWSITSQISNICYAAAVHFHP